MQSGQPRNEFNKEEWTKYSVNGIECKRNAIYQTILDNKFYTGKINLHREYHFNLHEKEFKDKGWGSTSARTHNESSDVSANFSLNTHEFAEKVGAISEDYKLLVERMIYALDMFYDCQQNYHAHAANLRIAIHNCMQLFTEKVSDTKAPYNNFLQQLSLEYFDFLFDGLAFALSTGYAKGGKPEMPSFGFDMSALKEEWDEHSSNIKKSQYLERYLSVMLKQADLLCNRLIKNDLFSDSASKKEIQNKFDAFKAFIKSMQTKKASLDAATPEVREQSSLSYKIASFLHFKQANQEPPAYSVSIESKYSPNK